MRNIDLNPILILQAWLQRCPTPLSLFYFHNTFRNGFQTCSQRLFLTSNVQILQITRQTLADLLPNPSHTSLGLSADSTSAAPAPPSRALSSPVIRTHAVPADFDEVRHGRQPARYSCLRRVVQCRVRRLVVLDPAWPSPPPHVNVPRCPLIQPRLLRCRGAGEVLGTVCAGHCLGNCRRATGLRGSRETCIRGLRGGANAPLESLGSGEPLRAKRPVGK